MDETYIKVRGAWVYLYRAVDKQGFTVDFYLQDHRRVKQRIRAMVGLKSFGAAVVTISGLELAEKIRKRQFKTGKPGGRTATVPEIWQAALAA